jgi:hypothetical protein
MMKIEQKSILDSNKTYIQEVDANGDGALTDGVFAAPYHTFVCPSKQRYLVVTNPDGNAVLVLSKLQVQAFATSADWMTCAPFFTH